MVRIWPDRDDGFWLYVEQAMAWNQEAPYRQWVCHLTHVGRGVFESHVFEMCDPLRFAGCWRQDTPLSFLTPNPLEIREGCAIILRRPDGRFVSSTLGRLCESSLRGATFAISGVEITESRLTS